jgi:hypothetical protein
MNGHTTREERGWWASNWKWCVPVLGGCGCIALIAAALGMGAWFYALTFGSMKSAWAYIAAQLEGARLARCRLVCRGQRRAAASRS